MAADGECFANRNKQTQREYSEREEFLLSLVSENRFILTSFIQNIISINSPPSYVISMGTPPLL